MLSEVRQLAPTDDRDNDSLAGNYSQGLPDDVWQPSLMVPAGQERQRAVEVCKTATRSARQIQRSTSPQATDR